MTDPIRASIYIKDPELVEYVRGIPSHHRSKHIRALITEDMERNVSISIDPEIEQAVDQREGPPLGTVTEPTGEDTREDGEDFLVGEMEPPREFGYFTKPSGKRENLRDFNETLNGSEAPLSGTENIITNGRSSWSGRRRVTRTS